MKKSFLEIEIEQQPDVIRHLLAKHFVNYAIVLDFPSGFDKIVFVASGSSYHACCLGKTFFENAADVAPRCVYSSEFLSKRPYDIHPDALYVFVSQSGQTKDTLNVLKLVKDKGAKTVCMVNNPDSAMFELADYKICMEAGEEKTIASTKAYTASILLLYLAALKVAQDNSKNITKFLAGLENLAPGMEKILSDRKKIVECAKFLSRFKSLPIISYGENLKLAQEGALKIKETSYVETSTYPLGEFLHGHIAILKRNSPVLALAFGDMRKFVYKNLKKIILDYKPSMVCITDYDKPLKLKGQIVIPKTSEIERIFNVTLVLQLLALEVAKSLKRNIDNPRGLSKVVG